MFRLNPFAAIGFDDNWFGIDKGFGSAGAELGERGYGGRTESAFGNLPPLDWVPNPGAEHGVDTRNKFPWDDKDPIAYFQWYESVLFARAREEDRQLLLGDTTKPAQLLLAAKFDEIQLPTSIPRAVFNGSVYEWVDIGGSGYWGWQLVNPLAPRSQPPKSTPDWLEKFKGPFPLGLVESPTSSPPPDPLSPTPGPPSPTPDRPSPTSRPASPIVYLTDAFFGVRFPNSDTPAATPLIGSPVREWSFTPPPTRSAAPSPASGERAERANIRRAQIIPPLPPISGSNDALRFNPSPTYSQYVRERGREAERKANPETAERNASPDFRDLYDIYAGLRASPLAALEDLVIGIINVPHEVVNRGTHAGEHLGRGYRLAVERGEYAEAYAEYLEAFIDLSVGFLNLASLAKPGSPGKPRASLGPAIATSLPVGTSPSLRLPALSTKASVLRTLRAIGTDESLATAKLIARNEVELKFVAHDPYGLGAAGYNPLGTNKILIVQSVVAHWSNRQVAGLVGHEAFHAGIQGLTNSNYWLIHELEAYIWQGRILGEVSAGTVAEGQWIEQTYAWLLREPIYGKVRRF